MTPRFVLEQLDEASKFEGKNPEFCLGLTKCEMLVKYPSGEQNGWLNI